MDIDIRIYIYINKQTVRLYSRAYIDNNDNNDDGERTAVVGSKGSLFVRGPSSFRLVSGSVDAPSGMKTKRNQSSLPRPCPSDIPRPCCKSIYTGIRVRPTESAPVNPRPTRARIREYGNRTDGACSPTLVRSVLASSSVFDASPPVTSRKFELFPDVNFPGRIRSPCTMSDEQSCYLLLNMSRNVLFHFLIKIVTFYGNNGFFYFLPLPVSIQLEEIRNEKQVYFDLFF